MQLASLRNHWFLILLIIVGLLWWPVFNFLNPSSPGVDWKYPLTDVDYDALVTHPESIQTWIAVVTVAGFIVVWILAFIRMWRISNITSRSILITTSLLLCAFFTCGSWASNLKPSSWDFRHVMSIQYQNKEYQLALLTYTKTFDVITYNYYVFECAPSGKICSKINEKGFAWPPEVNAQLAVSNDKLILIDGDDQTQILPTVN